MPPAPRAWVWRSALLGAGSTRGRHRHCDERLYRLSTACAACCAAAAGKVQPVPAPGRGSGAVGSIALAPHHLESALPLPFSSHASRQKFTVLASFSNHVGCRAVSRQISRRSPAVLTNREAEKASSGDDRVHRTSIFGAVGPSGASVMGACVSSPSRASPRVYLVHNAASDPEDRTMAAMGRLCASSSGGAAAPSARGHGGTSGAPGSATPWAAAAESIGLDVVDKVRPSSSWVPAAWGLAQLRGAAQTSTRSRQLLLQGTSEPLDWGGAHTTPSAHVLQAHAPAHVRPHTRR